MPVPFVLQKVHSVADVVLALHEVLGSFDRHRRIAAIGIGADGLAEFLVQWCTADQHDVVVTNALSFIVSMTTFM